MKKRDNMWREKAVLLYEFGVLSQRRIAVALNVPRSTLIDYVRAYRKSQETI